MASFITQHYLSVNRDKEALPHELVVDIVPTDAAWLCQALRERSGRTVKLSHHVRGERKKWLEIANASAVQAAASRVHEHSNTRGRFFALKQLLKKDELSWIECFDVSHTMGEAATASCIVFNNAGPVKDHYRRFNIQGITPGDDFAAIHQVILRRYQKVSEKQPDLIIIDGGPGQLAAAQRALAALNIHSMALMGIAKGAGRKPGLETLYFLEHSPVHLPADSEALHLIQQIRDEAHRFAIMGHRQQRNKKRTVSFLETVPGIGTRRRRQLLRHFGGIQGINRASLKELAQVSGIGQSLAERIFSVLHRGE
jgi:excinuclease ABC subunit C